MGNGTAEEIGMVNSTDLSIFPWCKMLFKFEFIILVSLTGKAATA
jgi:hypothetical protein